MKRMLLLAAVAAALQPTGGGHCQPPLEPKKYALLVAVTTYEAASLNEPPKIEFPEADAKALGALLEKSGYEVRYLLGPAATQAAIRAELAALRTKGNDPGAVLVGFFGHGVEYPVKGAKDDSTESYFCPYDVSMRERLQADGRKLPGADGNPAVEPDPDAAIAMTEVFAALRLAKGGNRVLIADCCRNDPGAARGRSFGANVKLSDLSPHTAALFACSRGERAFEDRANGHGLFTQCLLERLQSRRPDERLTASVVAEHLEEEVPRRLSTFARRGESQTPRYLTAGRVDLQLKSLLPQPPTFPFTASEAADYQRRYAAAVGKPLQLRAKNGMKLRLIPSGTFLMGSPDSEEQRSRDEKQHAVTLSRGFYLAETEVTQGQFKALLKAKESPRFRTEANADKLPVENVSWLEAIAYCNALSESEGFPAYYEIIGQKATIRDRQGRGYRLPTEAEWEWACRGGSGGPFSFEGLISPEKVNYDGKSPYGASIQAQCRERPLAAGMLQSNPYGLFEMHGNVSEWCWDGYDKHYYDRCTAIDPVNDDGAFRLCRGGGWDYFPTYCRSASRIWFEPYTRDGRLGFRICRFP